MSPGFQWIEFSTIKVDMMEGLLLVAATSYFFPGKGGQLRCLQIRSNLCFKGLIYDILTAIIGISLRCQKALDSHMCLAFFLFAFSVY